MENTGAGCFNIKGDVTIKTSEPGFTGDPITWFNEEDFQSKFLFKNNVKDKNADYYFNSYSSFHIHEEMLSDRVRTNAYKTAIDSNIEQFKGKVVLDIGCGTGVLSIFAARAGAKHVYSIEFAEIAYYAQQIVKDNKLQDKITVIKGKVEEIVLPVEKVDIIISEWMGYFLLYESMLDTVIYARDKWLVQDGLILPDKANIYLAAIEDHNYKLGKIHFWDNVYGVKMGCIKQSALSEPLIDNCDKEALNSDACKIFEIDLYTVSVADLDFTAKYNIQFTKDDTCHGLVTWFDIYFDKLYNKVSFSTSPVYGGGDGDENVDSNMLTGPTHWKQVVFYTENDLLVQRGDILTGSIAVRKSVTNFRQLDVKISYHIDGEKDKKDFVQMYKIQ